MTPEHADKLGRLADSLDAALYAAKLPLLPGMHIEALTGVIREARDTISDIVRRETGEDPWATNQLQG